MNSTNNEVKQLNERIDRLTDEISKLSFVVTSLFKRINDDLESIKTSVNPPSTQTKSINETIVLYSLSNEPLINELKLNNDSLVIRTCRSNIKSKRKLVNRHKDSIITVYREYMVSNPHNISSKVTTDLMDNTKLVVDTYYGHIIINKTNLNEILDMYDRTLKANDRESISLTSKEYTLKTSNTNIKIKSEIKTE